MIEKHPQLVLSKKYIGSEQAPLIVIDNFVADPDQLIKEAVTKRFSSGWRYYPGIRSVASMEYQSFFLNCLGPTLVDFFKLNAVSLKLTLCHYSLVTTPAERLHLLQRMPHIDSFKSNGLAAIHYLFKRNYGGTAFYRHRSTGYEVVDEKRHLLYSTALEREQLEPGFPGCQYINGDTQYFEQVGVESGVFNRVLIYRRNSLHSGCIDENFVPDSNPLSGRLSINTFIEAV